MPAPINYFALLGLEPRFHLGERDLEQRYHARSKLYHPDRHVRADGPTRVRNALATSELNQAYRTLCDPVRRAEYLLKLEGAELGDDRDGAKTAKISPTFLMEMLELREALVEARTTGDERAVDDLGRDVRARSSQALDKVALGFAAWESAEPAARAGHLAPITEALTALRYYRRFLDELEVHEEARIT